MKKGNFLTLAATMMIAIFALMAVGCSSNNPLSTDSSGTDSNFTRPNLSNSSVDWYGLAVSVNPEAREIEISSHAELIIVAQGAEVVYKDGGNETPIELSDINTGDSLEVRGDVQGDGTLLADRVRVRAADSNDSTEVEIKGRVESINPAARTMTVVGNPTLINVLPNAEVVHKVSSAEIAITLDQILVGDSVEVRGDMQLDGTLSADRVRLRDNDDFSNDFEFKSTITSIDYENGTMTVASRSETIMIDANTYIFTEVEHDTTSQTPLAKGSTGGDDDDDNGSDDDNRLKTRLTLTHLTVGDSVEVYANIVDPSTLYAVAIELEDGAFDLQNEIEFKDFLATVDVTTGIVTFQNQSWTGHVVNTTILRGLANESLTLDMFSSGEIVEVKGFATSETDIQIVVMEKENNL